MVELSAERIEEILHKETLKKEEQTTILRGVYTRYMRLYEKYLADIDALDNDMIAEMKAYHEETRSLVKYYYMDIPQEICEELKEFDDEYTLKLLGSDWHKYLFDSYKEFKDDDKNNNKTEESIKADFQAENLEAFYDYMDEIFREGFGTANQAAKKATNWFTGLLFGKEE